MIIYCVMSGVFDKSVPARQRHQLVRHTQEDLGNDMVKNNFESEIQTRKEKAFPL